MVVRLAMLAYTSEILTPPQTELPLHTAASGFPVHLFHVIGRDGQAVTPMQTTRFQHTPTCAGLHPLPETMHPLAAADFRLPGTFGCH